MGFVPSRCYSSWYLSTLGVDPQGIKFVTKPDGGTTFSSPFPVEWFFDIYPHLAPEDKPIEFTQEPGELIYVPRGW